ncbi:hypothetical protein QNA24_30090 [Rhodococcus qingshengii]|uniref:hypothetical protein n=1 Tax=Rhodococcus TaxID=1827 RepID=UPI001E48060E|nr:MULTISPECIES: hypothetical protein [Rhodococcus]MCD2099620.1 hypothetical protein [Rhodococcus rhodochrous]MCD2123988.1 hypothetical protein [Rhodococcus rhodochrous]MCQ4136579.1 hypothetical protein [Rhodococcus rhodochrous]MDJ0490634.1 hypothetical protein [Rhodococcus qingshengii]
MARIRQLKPEFWRSPDTANASACARLLYLAMWNWADDAGRGEADIKALEGFAFPNDDVKELSVGTSENFRHLLSEVQKCYEIDFYTVSGKPYYSIPTWSKHQRNERLAKGKHPGPEEGVTWDFVAVPNPRDNESRKMSEVPKISDPVSGCQGFMVSESQGVMVAVSEETSDTPEPENLPAKTEPERDDVKRLCEHLRERVVAHGNRRPNITAKWRKEARLLLDRDGVSEDEAHRLIDWCQDDNFWPAFIQSMPKFREKFDTIRMQAQRSSSTSSFGRPSMTEALTPHLAAGEKLIAAAQAQQHALRDESLTLALETPQTSIERPF